MKGCTVVYFLLVLLLSTAALAEPQLVARIDVARLMQHSVGVRTLLASAIPSAETQHTTTGTTLTLYREAGTVVFSPAYPVLTAGTKLTLKLQGLAPAEVEVYPRHTETIAWQPENNSLTALQAGESEVVFIIAKTLHILPLQVQAAPVQLASSHATPAEPALPASLWQAQLEQSSPLHAPPQRAQRATKESLIFKLERAQVAYRQVEIQVVDERTTASAHYPVSGMQVSLLGSSLQLRTDARGVVRIAAVPEEARLLLKLHDPQGRYMPAWQEIFVRKQQGRYRLTVRRELSFAALQTIVGRSQDTRLASLCAVLAGTQGETDFVVTSDVPADGVYYFNRLQLLAPQQQATGQDNRFCLFNVAPGPLTLFIADAEGQHRAVFTVGLAAGHHREEIFTLREGQAYRSWLAIAADMHRPVQGQATEEIVDFVQMRMVGDDSYLAKAADGLLETAPIWHRGRSHAVTRDAEFEDTLYQFTDTAPVGFVPLLLRGLIENTALLANTTHDASLGSAVIEYGARQGEDAAAVSLRLVDTEGRDVHTAWAVQEGGVTRSVFLNLNYGEYQVIAQNADGYWLAAGTVFVYSETVSFLRTGAAVVYRGKKP